MNKSHLSVESGVVTYYYLGEYFPYRKNGQKNPKFNPHSGFILSTKDKTERDFSKSIFYFTNQIIDLALELPIQPKSEFGPQVSIVIIPGSTPGKVSPGLIAIMKNLCKKDARFVLTDGVLTRTRGIEKLAKGGNRSTHIHKNSIQVDTSKLDTPYVMIVDDVLTTGNSFTACHDIIKRIAPQHNIFGVILGKTANE